jgi:hypothetical protein
VLWLADDDRLEVPCRTLVSSRRGASGRRFHGSERESPMPKNSRRLLRRPARSGCEPATAARPWMPAGLVGFGRHASV